MAPIYLTLSSLIGLITPIIGISAILKGEFKPQRTTRLIFFFLNTLIVAALLAQSDKTGIYLAIVQWIGSVSILLLSIKYGMGGKSKIDIFVLILAVLAIIVWKTTDNPALGLYMSITADFVGFLPTLIKSYSSPYTEDPKFYISDILAAFFSLLAIQTWSLQNVLFSMYVFVLNLVCACLIISQRSIQNRFDN